jgi:hypothetical protein
VLHHHGPVGCGRTWTLDGVVARARSNGFTVVRCTGDERSSEVPYAALSMVVRRITAHAPAIDAPDAERELLARAAQGMITSADTAALRRSVAGLLTSQTTPLLLALDDVHLLDTASKELLRFVVSRLDADAVQIAISPPVAPVARAAAHVRRSSLR